MFGTRLLGVVASLFILLAQPRMPRAEAVNAACTESNPAAIVAAAAQADGGQRADVVSAFSRAPAGGPADLVIAPPPRAEKFVAKRTYRIAFQLGRSDTPPLGKVRLRDSHDITAVTVPETHALRKSELVEQGATLLSFSVPNMPGDNFMFLKGAITVIVCNGGATEFVGRLDTVYSNRADCIFTAASVAFILYLLAAGAVSHSENKIRDPKLRWYRFADPVVLCSGPNAEGSTSRLQILFFTVILFELLFYIELRVGLLSEMSRTVLLLLGISGVGAASAKGVESQRNMVRFDNWAWLINKGWLPVNGLAAKNIAKWSDVVTGTEGFDVYRFQMLVFSLVVGIALIQVGFTDLADFTIPDSLLAVLGLSQVIYIGGKVVAPASFNDLDKALTDLRAAEGAFADLAVRRQIAAPAAGVPAATATAALAEYRAYTEQRKIVETMFTSLFGRPQDRAIREPRYT